MDDLQEARGTINDIDRQMAELFERRMAASKIIAGYKREHRLPVFDPSREQEIIDRNSEMVENPEVRAYYIRFMKDIMNLSKQYQHRLFDGLRVAYSGVEGAFANIAAKKIFPGGQIISYGDFTSAYKAVERGECDCAVLPIENSYAGEVGQVIDLLFKGNLHVNGIYKLKIAQNLLGVNGSDLKDIKRVISHPQALSQCDGYIKSHGFESSEALNTAIAAKTVAQSGDIHTAAIASAETARLYGLKILEENINESEWNFTKFAVFSPVANNENTGGKGNTFILLFTVNHEAGALAKAIDVIANHGFNMKVLRSRPMKELPWQYYFYVEAEGDEDSSETREMVRELSNHCEIVKTVGHYSAEINLEDGDKNDIIG